MRTMLLAVALLLVTSVFAAPDNILRNAGFTSCTNPGQPDYWDYATCLELAVLARNTGAADAALADALAHVREPWEPETTARNLRLILTARDRRGEQTGWLREIVKTLEEKVLQAAGQPVGP